LDSRSPLARGLERSQGLFAARRLARDRQQRCVTHDAKRRPVERRCIVTLTSDAKRRDV
jgi:hypothetical protein